MNRQNRSSNQRSGTILEVQIQKNICASILSKAKTYKKIQQKLGDPQKWTFLNLEIKTFKTFFLPIFFFFWGGVSSKTKIMLFGGQNKIVFNLNFKFVCLRLFFIVKISFKPIFTQKYWYLSPLEFFENENFDAPAPERGAHTSANILDLDF